MRYIVYMDNCVHNLEREGELMDYYCVVWTSDNLPIRTWFARDAESAMALIQHLIAAGVNVTGVSTDPEEARPWRIHDEGSEIFFN